MSNWGHQNYSGNIWGQQNPYNWHNPYGLSIPQVSFHGGCRKCRGAGIIMRRGMALPCRRCYRTHGYCVKCFGTGVNYFKNKPCHKCNGLGQRIRRGHKHRDSSSSSDSY
jgi:hypothetical protein